MSLDEIERKRLIGKRLKVIRQRAGLTQDEMAAQLGLLTRTWQNHEQGNSEPSAGTVLAIERRFNVDGIWLMEGPDSDPHPAKLLDDDLMLDAIEAVEKWLLQSKRTMAPRAKAAMALTLYRYSRLRGKIDDSFFTHSAEFAAVAPFGDKDV